MAGNWSTAMGSGLTRRREALRRLEARVIRCERCPRLVACRRSAARARPRRYRDWDYWARPVPGFGGPRARLLVIGLAPAADGGNRTGRIFTGDRSGDWLYEGLHAFGFANQATSTHRADGLRLTDCYVTAAVRCAPPENKPTPQEFANCRPYLLEELAVLRRVKVVVALGRLAFDAYLACRVARGDPRPAETPRFSHGGISTLPEGVTLIASYHPSQRNTFTGRLTRPMFHAVFRRARQILDAG